MIKTSISLQELRKRIYIKAKTDKYWRFWGLYCHICKKEVLQESYRNAKANNGSPGIDGKRFKDIESGGLDGFLEEIRQELLNRNYKPLPNLKVEIPDTICQPESGTSSIGNINLDVKSAGKPYEGKPHVRFEVAGDGKVLWRT